MEWVKVFGLISVLCFLGVIIQLLRFRKEFKNMDEDQVLTEELMGKWKKSLFWVTFLVVLGLIFRLIILILQILYEMP